MNFIPSPLTAAIAGAFAAIALPLLHKLMGGDSGLNIPFIVALVVTIALPARTFVVGSRPEGEPARGSIDTAMLKRIGVWILAAALVTAVRYVL